MRVKFDKGIIDAARNLWGHSTVDDPAIVLAIFYETEANRQIAEQEALAGQDHGEAEIPVFEVGKCYLDGHGNIVGPLEITVNSPIFVEKYPFTYGDKTYTRHGEWVIGQSISDSNLIPGAIELIAPAELTPLSYEEACALKPGDVVRCVEGTNYPGIKKGLEFEIIEGPDYPSYKAFIRPDGLFFHLFPNDCKYFAKVPKPGAAEPAIDDGAQDEDPADFTAEYLAGAHDWKAKAEAAEKRAEKAEAALEYLREQIELGLSQEGRPETYIYPEKSEDWRQGALHGVRMCAEWSGFRIIPTQPLRVEVCDE